MQVSTFIFIGASVLFYVLWCNSCSSSWCVCPSSCQLVQVPPSHSLVQVSFFVFFGTIVDHHVPWCNRCSSCSLVLVYSFIFLGANVLLHVLSCSCSLSSLVHVSFLIFFGASVVLLVLQFMCPFSCYMVQVASVISFEESGLCHIL